MDSRNSESVHTDESNRVKISVKACDHFTKVCSEATSNGIVFWCKGCHQRSMNGFVVEFDYNTMQYEVVKA